MGDARYFLKEENKRRRIEKRDKKKGDGHRKNT